MATFIERTEIGARGTTVAVKDLIDLAGLPTTAGCRAIAERAQPALRDAACLAGLRAAIDTGAARFVGMVEREPEGVGPVAETIRLGRDYLAAEPAARRANERWAAEFDAIFERVELLASGALVEAAAGAVLE